MAKKDFQKSYKALAEAHDALVEDITNKFTEGKEHTLEIFTCYPKPTRIIHLERVGEDLMLREDGKTIRHPIREYSVEMLTDIRDSIIGGGIIQ